MANQTTDQARGRGRPKMIDDNGQPLTRVTVCLFPDQVAAAAAVGNGSVSEGVRLIVAAAAQPENGQPIDNE